jgi:hypothetical protein
VESGPERTSLEFEKQLSDCHRRQMNRQASAADIDVLLSGEHRLRDGLHLKNPAKRPDHSHTELETTSMTL